MELIDGKKVASDIKLEIANEVENAGRKEDYNLCGNLLVTIMDELDRLKKIK